MSAASLVREVAACRAWERRLAAGSPQTRLHAAMPGAFERLLPLVMPAYGALAVGMGVKWDAEWWLYFIPWWWLLSAKRAFPRVLPTEWETLALPSRRAWLIGRLSLRVPILAWLCFCTIAGLLLKGLRDVPDPEGVRWGVIVSLALAPALLAVVAAWHPFAERHFGGGMAQVAALTAVGGVACMVVGGIVLATSRSDGGVIVGWVLLGLGFVLAALSAPSFLGLIRRPGGGPSRLGLLIWTGFVGAVSVASIACLVFSTIGSPHSLLIPDGDPWLPRASVLLPILVAATLLMTALDLWHRVEVAEVGLQPVTVAAARAKPVAPPKSRATAKGGSLLAAAWALYRGRWRIAPLPLLTFVPRLIWHVRAPALGFGAAWVGWVAGYAGGWKTISFGWFAVVLLLLVPNHFELPSSRRLHLLGADWSGVARHNLRTGLLTAALPVLLGACAAALLPLFTPVAGIGAILAVAGFMALRASTGPLDLVFDPLPDGKAGLLVLAVLLGALVTGWFVAPAETHLAFGIAVFVLGVATVLRDLRDREGAGRRLEGAASDD